MLSLCFRKTPFQVARTACTCNTLLELSIYSSLDLKVVLTVALHLQLLTTVGVSLIELGRLSGQSIPDDVAIETELQARKEAVESILRYIYKTI